MLFWGFDHWPEVRAPVCEHMKQAQASLIGALDSIPGAISHVNHLPLSRPENSTIIRLLPWQHGYLQYAIWRDPSRRAATAMVRVMNTPLLR